MSNRLMENAVGGGVPVTGLIPFAPFDGRQEAVNDNAVHELTLIAGTGADYGFLYVIQAIGGEGISIVEAAAAPAVATVRGNGIVLLNGDSWTVSPQVHHDRFFCVKLVDGTANADMHIVAMDGGGGL